MMSREWTHLPPGDRDLILRHQGAAPVKIGAIVKDFNLRLLASTLPAGISGEIRPDDASPAGFTIKVNRHDSHARQRFTVAHELSHYLLHRDQIGRGIVDDVLYRSTLTDRREAEANRLAADLLMPDSLIEAWLDRASALGVQDIPLYLAERFEVSEAAMRIRLGLA
ncbi:ImmA/IrrE family metallo-endopeptidase [Brevundimonas sp. NPDC055814]